MTAVASDYSEAYHLFSFDVHEPLFPRQCPESSTSTAPETSEPAAEVNNNANPVHNIDGTAAESATAQPEAPKRAKRILKPHQVVFLARAWWVEEILGGRAQRRYGALKNPGGTGIHY